MQYRHINQVLDKLKQAEGYMQGASKKLFQSAVENEKQKIIKDIK